jgi:hypothetical protein
LFARNEERLAKAKGEILRLGVHEKQELNTVSLDLADGSQVRLSSQGYRALLTK